MFSLKYIYKIEVQSVLDCYGLINEYTSRSKSKRLHSSFFGRTKIEAICSIYCFCDGYKLDGYWSGVTEYTWIQGPLCLLNITRTIYPRYRTLFSFTPVMSTHKTLLHTTLKGNTIFDLVHDIILNIMQSYI